MAGGGGFFGSSGYAHRGYKPRAPRNPTGPENLAVDWFRITWNNTELLDTLATGDQRVNDAVMAILDRDAPKVEAYMKQNAPWTDRTGNARQGLRAQSYDAGPTEKGIILYQQVPYGIWLEIKYSGKYAIILPTIRAMGPVVMDDLSGILGRIKFT